VLDPMAREGMADREAGMPGPDHDHCDLRHDGRAIS
jgi:hypothetical protein